MIYPDIVTVRSFATFERDFPTVEVGARTAPSGRSQDRKDWWAARRATSALYHGGLLTGAVRLRRIPETTICSCPDFEFCSELGFGTLEITEATDPDDQREMTKNESEVGPSTLGANGGRGKRGFPGDTPFQMIATDIAEAVNRKASKYDLSMRGSMILAIYVNSNPAIFLDTFDKLTPFVSVKNLIDFGFRAIVAFKDRDEAYAIWKRTDE